MSIEALNTDLTAFEQNVHKELVKFTEFVQTYMQVLSLIQNLKELITPGLNLYEHLEIQLDAIALSNLTPAIIEPASLASILSEIQSALAIKSNSLKKHLTHTQSLQHIS